jgi:hypothetical protein
MWRELVRRNPVVLSDLGMHPEHVGAGEKLTPLRRLRFDPPGWWRRRPG